MIESILLLAKQGCSTIFPERYDEKLARREGKVTMQIFVAEYVASNYISRRYLTCIDSLQGYVKKTDT